LSSFEQAGLACFWRPAFAEVCDPAGDHGPLRLVQVAALQIKRYDSRSARESPHPRA
jgi:hypothetical protein